MIRRVIPLTAAQMADKFRKHYPDGKVYGWGDSEAVYQRLLALPVDATPDQIDEAMSMPMSWTMDQCTGCHQYSRVVFLIGEEPDYESATVYFCESCAKKAAEFILKELA